MEVDFGALRATSTESSLALLKNATRGSNPLLESKDVERKLGAGWFHGEVIGRFSVMTARALRLPEREVRRIELAGKFHDIGKIFVPDDIIEKPGPLTDAEWVQVKKHPEAGARLLEASGFAGIAPLVLAHHEWLNGTGYGHGLSGEEIPLGARVLSVTDAYDAMTSPRPYRDAMTHDQARDEIWRWTGAQFDPDVVCAFLSVLDEVAQRRGTPSIDRGHSLG